MGLTEALLTVTLVHLLAAASPGPDFVMVSQQSLLKGRRAGLLCSLGIALGLSVHILYSSLGMAALVSQSTLALSLLKYLAAGYLIWLGFKGLRSQAAQ
ncbi:MAG: LysE family transporter, partial [Marinobacterium sp.]